ncbi:hypothetical protein CesoFtcFv8_008170 [Champsocephalus esox]|uniref:N-acetylglucosaminyldiphosphodolichol N-acetylglucosaminyltransferase n=1 Tax=Champsocephalus esox TaxID=159716 RepID=A0AAN8H1B0_9TELE|nr:hypothetical protein CesoFtcFv8_008170 [Champsocephalus esox]
MAIPASSPWLVSEMGEALCSVVAPPPYSYDPNGMDLPRDCRVLQYYFNLGVQSCWQQQSYPPTPQEVSYPYQHYSPYLSQEPPLHERGHTARVYCPPPTSHMVGYITAQPPHHTTHYLPPSI